MPKKIESDIVSEEKYPWYYGLEIKYDAMVESIYEFKVLETEEGFFSDKERKVYCYSKLVMENGEHVYGWHSRNKLSGRELILDPLEKLLFNYPAAQKAMKIGKPICLVESEADALFLQKQGIPTVAYGGCWIPKYAADLATAQVIILTTSEGKEVQDTAKNIVKDLAGNLSIPKIVSLNGSPKEFFEVQKQTYDDFLNIVNAVPWGVIEEDDGAVVEKSDDTPFWIFDDNDEDDLLECFVEVIEVVDELDFEDEEIYTDFSETNDGEKYDDEPLEGFLTVPEDIDEDDLPFDCDDIQEEGDFYAFFKGHLYRTWREKDLIRKEEVLKSFYAWCVGFGLKPVVDVEKIARSLSIKEIEKDGEIYYAGIQYKPHSPFSRWW